MNPMLTSGGNPCFISSMARAQNELLTNLLKEVSRSFYLTAARFAGNPASAPQIGLAYLLARTTDTIADTEIVPVEQRLKMLQALRERILGTSAAPLEFRPACATTRLACLTRVLLEKCEASLRCSFKRNPPSIRKLIREVLDVITGGQELDLNRFGNPTPGKLGALQTNAELDDYTYRVAGCVGKFWTRICLAHQFSTEQTARPAFEDLGVRFGKGLRKRS